jgi:hypothetical protein
MAAVDNDDVSGYYITSSNYFSYSPFALKADFGGHDNQWFNNVAVLHTGAWFDGPAMIWNTYSNQSPGHQLHAINNTIMSGWCQNGPWPGPQYTCESNWTIGMVCQPLPGASILANNTYYLPMTPGQVVYECGLPFPEYQASCADCDPGSAAYPFPEDSVIINAGRAAVGMPPAAGGAGEGAA